MIHKEAIEAFKQAFCLPFDDAERYLFVGISNHLQRDYNRAIKSLKKVVRLRPNKAVVQLALVYLGVAYTNTEQDKEAVKTLEQAVQFQPDDPDAYYCLGFAYSNVPNYTETVRACKKAVQIKPDFFDAHFELGCAYENLKRYKDAIEAYKKARRLRPDDYWLYIYLGDSYHKFKYFKEAIKIAKQAITLQSNNACGYSNLGGCVFWTKTLYRSD